MSYPILYQAGETNFNHLGLGILKDTISAVVSEDLNGKFELDLVYAYNNKLSKSLLSGNIIKVDAGNILKEQLFTIAQVSKTLDGKISVHAEHISYIMQDLTLKPKTVIYQQDAQNALKQLLNAIKETDHGFTVVSDISTISSSTWSVPDFKTPRDVLAGVKGSILDNWGGEYLFDNRRISLLKQRGSYANTIVAYGRNMLDFEQETSILETYTSIYPVVVKTEKNAEVTHTLPELAVDSQYLDKYANRKTLLVDFSDKFDDKNPYSDDKLRVLANAYIKANKVGIPKVTMTIKTLDLAKMVTYDYKAGRVERLDLADTVKVYFDRLGITTEAKVVGIKWNVLKESYDEYVLGERKATFGTVIRGSIAEVKAVADDAKKNAITALVSADGKNTNYYGNSSDGAPTNPKKGDIWFVKDGDKTIIKTWNGSSWVDLVSSDWQEIFEEKLTEELAKAKVELDAALLEKDEALAGLDKKISDELVVIDTSVKEAQADANTATTRADDAVDKANANVQAIEANTQLINDVNAIANTANDNANKAIGDVGKLSEDVLALDTIANKAKSDADTALINANKGMSDAKTALDNFNNLKIGGRNYLRNSNFADGLNYWSNNPSNAVLENGVVKIISTVTGAFSQSNITQLTDDDIVIVSFDAKTDDIGVLHAEMWGGQGAKDFTLTKDFKRYSAVFTVKSTKWLYFWNKNSSFNYIRKLKLEIGNKATDWSPSPDDVQIQIDNVNNQLSTKVSQTSFDTLNGTVASQGTQITQNKSDILIKADKTYVDTLKGTVDTQGTQITQNAKDIQVKANKSSVDTLTGRVSANETAIDVTSQGISALVTKTDGTNTSLSQFKQDYEGFKGTVYTKGQTDTKVSTVQQSVDNFKTTVSNTYSSKSETDNKVTAVQANVDKIGNYTAYANSADGTDGFTAVYPNLNLLNFKSGLILGKYLFWADGLRIDPNPARAIFDYVSVIPGTTYTINSNWDKTERIAIYTYDSNDRKNANFIYDGGVAKWFSPSTVGRVITQKTTLSIPDGMNFIRIVFFAKDTSATLTLQDMLDAKTKVEEGSTKTPWMPSEKELTSNDIPKYVGYSVRQSENPKDFSWQPYGELNSYNIIKATTSIEQNSKDIALKANKTEVDTLSGKVLATESSLQIQDGKISALNTKTDGHTTQIGTLESSYNGFKTTVANTYADKASVASQITQSATAVTSNVQSWTNNKLTAYSTTQQTDSSITNAVADKADKSQVTQLSNQITSTVTSLTNETLITTQMIQSTTLKNQTYPDMPMVEVPVTNGESYTVSSNIPNSGTEAAAIADIWYLRLPETAPNSNINGAFEGKSITLPAISDKIYIVFRNQSSADKFASGQYWVKVTKTPVSQSQITQLANDINLRVTKNSVVNQINISPESILIAGNKIQITGQTYIENGVITSAKIQDLSASKLTAGTIDGSVINVININAGNITTGTLNADRIASNSITSTHISVSSLSSLSANLGIVTAGTINAATVNIININAASITTGTLNADRIGANSITADKIKATSLALFSDDTYLKIMSDGIRFQSKAQLRFGPWIQVTDGKPTSTEGLYLGGWGNASGVKHIAFTRSDGSTFMMRAEEGMDYGTNKNVSINDLNIYDNIQAWRNVRIHGALINEGDIIMGGSIQEASIQYDRGNKTMSFRIPGGYSNGSSYWFNNKITCADGFASSSLLSLKNIKGAYEGNALEDICQTEIMEYRYKNNPNDRQLSPIIDDINEIKKYHLPDIINDGKTVNLYAMNSLSWLAIKQLAKKLENIEEKLDAIA